MIASVADLAAALRRDIDPDDPAAVASLASAQGLVETYLAQPVEHVADDTIALDGTGRRLMLLPCWPVTAISSVAVDGETLDADAYSWNGAGQLRRRNGNWPEGLRNITVVYSHGHDPVPASIKAVVIGVAARLYDTPVGVRQETIGAYSVTYSAGVGAVLQAGETAVLEPYRQVGW